MVVVAGRAPSTEAAALSEQRIPAVGAENVGKPEPCDATLAERRVDEMFAALSAGDWRTAGGLFPRRSDWQFKRDDKTFTSSGGGVVIQPRSSQRSVLATAVRRHDAADVIRLFPAAGGWQFDMTPLFADVRQELVATRLDRMKPIAQQFTGMQLVRTEPVQGSFNDGVEHVSPDGLVRVDEFNFVARWRLEGERLLRNGYSAFEGASKMAIYCELGKFKRIVLAVHTRSLSPQVAG